MGLISKVHAGDFTYTLPTLSRSQYWDARLRLGPGLVPAARLCWQQGHFEETEVLLGCPTSGRCSSPRLPGPLSIPVHLHIHTAAPAGPGCCALAWSCCEDTQSCGDHLDPKDVLAWLKLFYSNSKPTLHDDIITSWITQSAWHLLRRHKDALWSEINWFWVKSDGTANRNKGLKVIPKGLIFSNTFCPFCLL